MAIENKFFENYCTILILKKFAELEKGKIYITYRIVGGLYKDVEVSSKLLLGSFVSNVISEEKFPLESHDYIWKFLCVQGTHGKKVLCKDILEKVPNVEAKTCNKHILVFPPIKGCINIFSYVLTSF